MYTLTRRLCPLQKMFGIVLPVLILAGVLSPSVTRAQSGWNREVSHKTHLVTPVLFPKSEGGTADDDNADGDNADGQNGGTEKPAPNDIRLAYKEIYEPYWLEVSYGNFQVDTKTYGYLSMQWPKEPLGEATGGPDFDDDGIPMEITGEDFAERDINNEPNLPYGGSVLIEDGFWTPGERFRDNSGTGEYSFGEPWVDVQIPDGEGDGEWDEAGERFVDLDGNEEFTSELVTIEVYDKSLDDGADPNDGLKADGTAAVREIEISEFIADSDNPNYAAWPESGDYQGSEELREFSGDYPTVAYDENGEPDPAGPVANEIFDYGENEENPTYNNTNQVISYKTVEITGEGDDETAEIVDVEVAVYQTIEPFEDSNDNDEWDGTDPFEDFLIRWDKDATDAEGNEGNWVKVTNQYIYDNYPPLKTASGEIYDVGAGGMSNYQGYGPFAGTEGGNGIPDNAEALMLRSGDGGDVVLADGTTVTGIEGPNGVYDGPEGFFDRGNTKMVPQNRPDNELLDHKPPVATNWDPHNFYPGGWQDWWTQTFGTEAPDWGNFIDAESFDPPTDRKVVDPETNEEIAMDGDGTIYPDADQEYYDSPREFRDLPSAIYHAGGDNRLGEVTSPFPDSNEIWGEDIGNNNPPVDNNPDSYIEAAGPLAYNINGLHGWDAGNLLTLEYLTWRTDGDSITDSVTNNSSRQGGWAGVDHSTRRCRDVNLDGLIDQGEAPDPGFNNYITDADPTTEDSGGGDAGRNSNYPYCYQRLYEDIIEALDTAEDFSTFSVMGDIVDYLGVIYPDLYGGTEFAGVSGQWHGGTHEESPHGAMPYLNGTSIEGGILTRDNTQLINFGGQVRNMGTGAAGGGVGATGDYGMAIMAHEAHHDWLGAPDLYDYDTWNGIIYNNPIGSNDLMAGGGLVHSIGPMKYEYEWSEEQDLKSILEPGDQETLLLYPVENNGNQYYVFRNETAPQESFWIWYESGDTDYTKQSGPGVYIAHEDLRKFGNAIPKQQRINNHFTWEMVQADGLNELQDNVNSGDDGDPWPGSTNNTTFTADTNPASRWWSEVPTGLEILDIIMPTNATDPARVVFRWNYRPVPELSFINPPGSEGALYGSYAVTYEAWDLVGDTKIDLYRDEDGSTGDYNGVKIAGNLGKKPGDQRDAYIDQSIQSLPDGEYYYYALLKPEGDEKAHSAPRVAPNNVGSGMMTIDDVVIDPFDANFPASNSSLQTWTVTYNGSDWEVVGSETGAEPTNATTGTAYTTSNDFTGVTFTINAGTKAFVEGDSFTFKTTGLTPYSEPLHVQGNRAVEPESSGRDGLPDYWKEEYFDVNNEDVDPQDDTDGDGLLNINEFRAGTDPRDPTDGPAVTGSQPLAPQHVAFSSMEPAPGDPLSVTVNNPNSGAVDIIVTAYRDHRFVNTERKNVAGQSDATFQLKEHVHTPSAWAYTAYAVTEVNINGIPTEFVSPIYNSFMDKEVPAILIGSGATPGEDVDVKPLAMNATEENIAAVAGETMYFSVFVPEGAQQLSVTPAGMDAEVLIRAEALPDSDYDGSDQFGITVVDTTDENGDTDDGTPDDGVVGDPNRPVLDYYGSGSSSGNTGQDETDDTADIYQQDGSIVIDDPVLGTEWSKTSGTAWYILVSALDSFESGSIEVAVDFGDGEAPASTTWQVPLTLTKSSKTGGSTSETVVLGVDTASTHFFDRDIDVLHPATPPEGADMPINSGLFFSRGFTREQMLLEDYRGPYNRNAWLVQLSGAEKLNSALLEWNEADIPAVDNNRLMIVPVYNWQGYSPSYGEAEDMSEITTYDLLNSGASHEGHRAYLIYWDRQQAGQLMWQAVPLGEGWEWSPWFGYFSDQYYPWIYHRDHKWMYVNERDEGLYLYTIDMGWLFSSKDLYPYMYSFETESWMWYHLDQDDRQRWFLNLSTGEWQSR